MYLLVKKAKGVSMNELKDETVQTDNAKAMNSNSSRRPPKSKSHMNSRSRCSSSSSDDEENIENM